MNIMGPLGWNESKSSSDPRDKQDVRWVQKEKGRHWYELSSPLWLPFLILPSSLIPITSVNAGVTAKESMV